MTTRLTRDERLEIAEELREIKDQIAELVGQAENLLEGTGIIGKRARAYWLAHIQGALEGPGSMYTLDDTIEELEAVDDDECDSQAAE